MDTLIFSIGQLLNQKLGEYQVYEFSTTPKTENFENIEFDNDISGTLTIAREYGSINAKVENFSTTIFLPCQKCLNKFPQKIEIEELEGVFHENITKSANFQEGDFEIDMKNHTIDISDMLRQEIILHFPAVSVCSKSCKGLCTVCGCDLNEKSCNCDPNEGHKPLSILKELYNGKTSGTQTKDI